MKTPSLLSYVGCQRLTLAPGLSPSSCFAILGRDHGEEELEPMATTLSLPHCPPLLGIMAPNPLSPRIVKRGP